MRNPLSAKKTNIADLTHGDGQGQGMGEEDHGPRDTADAVERRPAAETPRRGGSIGHASGYQVSLGANSSAYGSSVCCSIGIT